MDDARLQRVALPQAWEAGRGWGAEGKEVYFSFSLNQAQVYAATNITTTRIAVSLLVTMIATMHC